MALCNADDLLAEACANGFECIADDPQMVNTVAIELLRTATGNTSDANTLLAQATATGYLNVAKQPQGFLAAANQLLCDSNTS